MSTVMIAVDGTKSDRAVVGAALSLFGANSDFIVVSVSDNPALIGGTAMSYATASIVSSPYLDDFARGIEERAEAAEHRAEAAASAAGLVAGETLGEVGDPATLLVELAKERGVDVIAIGASERSWMSRLLDPSVEAAVVGRATCPVLVVHPDQN